MILVNQEIEWGKIYLWLQFNYKVMQDVMVNMVMMQFINGGVFKMVMLFIIYCNYVIKVQFKGEKDLCQVKVYNFLVSEVFKYSMGFWRFGFGIIYFIILENYVQFGIFLISIYFYIFNSVVCRVFVLELGVLKLWMVSLGFLRS